MRLLAALCLVAAPAVAADRDFPVNDYGLIEFLAPSQNIGCTYVPEGGTDVYEPPGGGPELTCTRIAPVYTIATLLPEGPVAVVANPGEQGCCSVAPVLGYGDSWSEGPFTCISERTGMTCTRSDGHGFSMARRAVKSW